MPAADNLELDSDSRYIARPYAGDIVADADVDAVADAKCKGTCALAIRWRHETKQSRL